MVHPEMKEFTGLFRRQPITLRKPLHLVLADTDHLHLALLASLFHFHFSFSSASLIVFPNKKATHKFLPGTLFPERPSVTDQLCIL